MARKPLSARLPRTRPAYDNRTHGARDYDAPTYPDEPPALIARRTAAYDALHREMTSTTRSTTTPAVIKWVSGQSYTVGDATPVDVTDEEHAVLSVFLVVPVAMKRPKLEKRAGIQNAPRVMKQLATGYGGLFTVAVHRPGRRGRGGYYIGVIDASK